MSYLEYDLTRLSSKWQCHRRLQGARQTNTIWPHCNLMLSVTSRQAPTIGQAPSTSCGPGHVSRWCIGWGWQVEVGQEGMEGRQAHPADTGNRKDGDDQGRKIASPGPIAERAPLRSQGSRLQPGIVE